MNKNTLLSLGLSPSEIKIYMALLELGPSSPTILEKHTHTHRPIVYKALESLVAKNIVSMSIKGKRKIYLPESPDKLISIFKNIEDRFISEIEDLHQLYSSPKHERPLVTYGVGKKAIRSGMRDVIDTLKKGDTYYRYSPGYELFDKKNFLPRKYQTIRDQKQLERFVIANDDGKIHSKKLNKHIKNIPKSFDLFNDRIGLMIYANKVLIFDYESESAITINHAKFAEFQKKIFKFLFSKM